VPVKKTSDKNVVAAIARLNGIVEQLYANQLSAKVSQPSNDPPASNKKPFKFRRAPQ
jgi:hypothetical protein